MARFRTEMVDKQQGAFRKVFRSSNSTLVPTVDTATAWCEAVIKR